MPERRMVSVERTGTGAESDDALEPTSLLPAVDVTTTGFSRWIDSAVAFFCIGTVVPGISSASEQLSSLHSVWLSTIGGGLLAASFLMPVYAWSRRGVRPIAALYAAFVLLGLVTWPLAWQPGAPSAGTPWLWLCLGLGTICAALATTIRIAVIYGSVVTLAFFLLRLTPSGGSAGLVLAAQDALMLGVQPGALLLVLHLLRRATRALDNSLVRAQAERAQAAVSQALVDERRRLDALVHDEVMTTLVAAAKSGPGHDPALAAQAQSTIASLESADVGAESTADVPAEQVVQLIADVIASVCPRAVVHGQIPELPVAVPHRSVRVLTQAAREAALNAEKHARASEVTVELVVSTSVRRVNVMIDVSDDGIGFDLDQVPAERLGIRVSLHERMKTIGGSASVRSTVGEGTSVRLTWSGERPKPVVTQRYNSVEHPDDHPLLSRLQARPFTLLALGLLSLYLLVGVGSLSALEQPMLGGVALVLTVVSVALGLAGFGRRELPAWQAWAVVGGTLAITVLSLLAMPRGAWPGHTTWFAGAVMLLLVMLMIRGYRVHAWAGAGEFALVVLVAALVGRPPLSQALTVGLMPVAWLALLTFLFWWFDSIATQIETAQQASGEAASANAAVFSKLVLREVWLTDLQGQVGAMLRKIGDVRADLTDADREECLLMEGTLRDGIRASNLKSPSLATAIAQARLRGVEVTLVDNRGSRLPDGVRQHTLDRLEEVVKDATGGRVVARTAPEGYDDVVTILRVDPAGETQLTTIDTHGTIATSTP